MTAPLHEPSAILSPLVTPATNRAVWNALDGKCLTFGEIRDATGMRDGAVTETVVAGLNAKKLRIADRGVGDRGIERVE